MNLFPSASGAAAAVVRMYIHMQYNLDILIYLLASLATHVDVGVTRRARADGLSVSLLCAGSPTPSALRRGGGAV